jgi:PAS domain S-box-containing protein
VQSGALELLLEEHCEDAVLCVDTHGTITFWNDGAERLIGFARAQALGASLDLIIPAQLRERHWAGFNAVIGSSMPPSPAWVSTPVQRADGTIVRMAITVMLLKRGGVSAGMMGILSPLHGATSLQSEPATLRSRE